MRDSLALALALACASSAAAAAELERDAVLRPLVLDAGQRQVAVDFSDGYFVAPDASGRFAGGKNVYALTPQIRAGLGSGLEAELASHRGFCVSQEGCYSRLADLGALLHARFLKGPIEVAALGGAWGWNSAPVGTGGEPVLRRGISLLAGLEARVQPWGALALRARAAFSAAIAGRAPRLSQAAAGYVEYNRDALEATLGLTWGPARWFSVAVEASWSAVLDPPLAIVSNPELPLAVRFQFALPAGIDVGFGFNFSTLLRAHRVGNLDYALHLSVYAALAF